MIGHQTPEETKIWLQTQESIPLEIAFGLKEANEKRILNAVTKEKDWNTLTINLSKLTPGAIYTYTVSSKGRELYSGEFTTPRYVDKDSLRNFSFAFGSCTYINEKQYDRDGEPFGKALNIINSIEKKHPNFMLWLGDNIYLRKGEWSSKTGIYRRYTNFKSHPALQSFWKSMPHYAIWDDHDFGPNDADRSFYNKEITLQAFKDFWANPSYGVNGQSGITSYFAYEDVAFFLLDNRYFRSPNKRNTGEREILGKAQIEWLIDALVNSKASFKFIVVGGQVVSDAAVYENHATLSLIHI